MNERGSAPLGQPLNAEWNPHDADFNNLQLET
jgi:hypothetical protein